MRTRHFTVAAAVVACAAIGLTPGHAETFKLTVVAAAPPIVTYVKVTKDNFIPEVNRRLAASGSKHKIEWTQAYSQSLAKFNEVFEAVEEGIAHVGLVLKNFEPSNLPLEQYATSAPFAKHTTAQMITIDRNMRKKVPALNAAYVKHNQVFLESGANHSMQLFTAFPVKTVDDLKGRKLGSSGAFGQWLRGTGAVVVNSSMNQSYQNIKNGVYEGYPIGVNLAFAYKTYQAAPYMTTAHFGVSPTSAITVNQDTWKSLPGEVRTIMQDVARKWPTWQIKADEGRYAKFLGIMKKNGIKISDMPDAERKRWAMMMPNIAKEWAERQEKKGLPGRAVLTAFMDELRALDVPISRQWDKE